MAGIAKASKINILFWLITFIIKSIAGSFIMLNTMMETENRSFANISTPFLRCCEHDLRKGIEILAKLVFSFCIIVFNVRKLLVILFISKINLIFIATLQRKC